MPMTHKIAFIMSLSKESQITPQNPSSHIDTTVRFSSQRIRNPWETFDNPNIPCTSGYSRWAFWWCPEWPDIIEASTSNQSHI